MIRRSVTFREAEIGAWEVLDWQAVQTQAERLMMRAGWADLPLAGVPVGVKDIFDTADFPTSYGSEIYAGHRPVADASAVATLRAAGAILPGKTLTTEFAYFKPGKTRNPHDTARSPGGSSSGSAAAVAAGMVPLAIGSQTAGSTIRPAAYCGIVGFKPSLNRISLAGVKRFAGSMDTAGCFAVSVQDVAQLAGILARRPDWVDLPAGEATPCIRLAKTPEWGAVAPWLVDAIDDVARRLSDAGAKVAHAVAPEPFTGMAEVQKRIMAAEAVRDLAAELERHRERLSAPLLALLEEGERLPPTSQEADYAGLQEARASLSKLFADADILLAPSTADEAPKAEDGTGSPDLSRAWTLLGLPSITLPVGKGPNGLPFGIQLATRPGRDRDLLIAALWVEASLSR